MPCSRSDAKGKKAAGPRGKRDAARLSHLENMLEVTCAGALVFPPVMVFYTRPETVRDIVNRVCGA